MKVSHLSDVVRMLNLIPYFEQHPGYSLMEASRDLGIDAQQLLKDLHCLWCCGPGDMHGELVDMEKPSYHGVLIHDDQGLDRALRLTRVEAAALLLILEQLEAIPDIENRQAVVSAAEKLRSIMGVKAGVVYDSDAARTTNSDEEHATSVIAEAIRRRVLIRCDYVSARSNTRRERVVDPHHLFSREGQTYLSGLDTETGEERSFRIDRMESVRATEEAAGPLTGARDFDPSDPFHFQESPEWADIELHPQATWMADYWPMELGQASEDGWITAQMPWSSSAWMCRFLLEHSDRIHLIGPESLRAQVAERARSALGSYAACPQHSKKG
ncbi:WYL domain-containing protein [Corynebacterium uropygiale]|uniref:WYL domain-containing protein n=1 Tax=Corynebacterium uropygiale TaxID=1775911 RepID=A0A9X1QPB5_9CORY|nr:WYL domain-containing protein [Corynebacterium uropygiale]MCF4006656.1 WYL domain-containing protein [Corynebacterium uropygiale]